MISFLSDRWLGGLRCQLLTLFNATVLTLLLISVAGLLLLVKRTEREGWQGRQQEATQRVAPGGSWADATIERCGDAHGGNGKSSINRCGTP